MGASDAKRPGEPQIQDRRLEKLLADAALGNERRS
jgi:hypothetical protein